MNKIVTLLAVTLTLMVTPAAFGAPTTYVGAIKKDADSKVRAEVVVNDDKGTVKLKHFKVVGINYLCESGTEGERTIRWKQPVTGSKTGAPYQPTFYLFHGNQQLRGGYADVTGTFDEPGDPIKGSVSVSFREFPDDEESPMCHSRGRHHFAEFKMTRK